MGLDEKDNLVFFGAGVTNQEMDVEFKKLYDSLLSYKNNIFHLVDTICNDCEAGERLAMNIAERDSALLQRLVAKECDQRRMVRKAGKESVLDQLRRGESPEMTVNQILQSRSESLKDSSKAD
ncbi:cytochrome P450 [archaeon]|nr:cytochrome P450 [archaeon]